MVAGLAGVRLFSARCEPRTGAARLHPGTPVHRFRPVRAARTELAGGVPVWIPLLLLATSLAWLVNSLQGDLDLLGFTRIDPRRTRIEDGPGLVDARWRQALSAKLASLPEISSVDLSSPSGPRAIHDALRSLPFVAEIGEGRVLWPDGYEIRVRFREPAACVLVGERYLAVSADAVVLPGEWVRPPWLGAGWLPLLVAPSHLLDGAAPGARLLAPELRDALAVAISMRASLAEEDFETMGAPAIDATCARRASVDEPGVVLYLEGDRRVFFGRAPGSGEPGELPEASKWESLRRGLKALRASSADARDWELLDVRWDVPDVLWRDVELGPAGDPGQSGEREESAEHVKSAEHVQSREQVMPGEHVKSGEHVLSGESGGRASAKPSRVE